MAFVSTFTPSILSHSTLSSSCSSYCNRSAISTTTTTSRRLRSSKRITKSQAESTETSTSNSNSNNSNGNVTGEEEEEVREVILDENIVGFCSIDPGTGKRLELSIREKEALFLDALQAFYNGKSMLSNDEFDTLKEELTWQGSDVVTLSKEEFKFLDAAKAYEQGKSIMSDEEFDKLKTKLFEQGSPVAIARGPRCSIQRKITFSDIIPDKKRTFALYIPAGFLVALSWLSLAYELTPLHQVDPVISLMIGSPIIFILARVITGFIVPNAQIMVGDCPNCGKRTHVLFGDVLNQKGFNDEAMVKCEKCKAQLRIEKETSRMILVKQA